MPHRSARRSLALLKQLATAKSMKRYAVTASSTPSERSITCPFCVSVWVATGLSIGMVFAPKLTRLVATTFTAVAASDFLQLAYASAERPPTDSSGDLRIPIVTSIEFVCRLGHGSREGDASDRR